jgi:hypothetical protein
VLKNEFDEVEEKVILLSAFHKIRKFLGDLDDQLAEKQKHQ